MKKKLLLSALLLLCTLLGVNSKVLASTNLVLNPSVQSVTSNLPTSWNKGNWGTNSTTFTYPVTGYNGTNAVKVAITSYTDGDAKWYFNDVVVKPSTVYTFSDYYTSNVATSVVVRYTSTANTYTYVTLGTPTASTSWKQVSYELTTPSDTSKLTIFHLLDKVGTLTTDEFSLTENSGTTPTTDNKFSKGMVSLTFDDGWATMYKNAIPKLNTAGYKSTQYLIADYLNGEPGYLTKAQATAMKNSGHEIGSHTNTHPQLPLLEQAQLSTEISGSKATLQSLGLGNINSIAFPYGEYNQTVINQVMASGYTSARTALYEDSGYNYKDTHKYQLKTFSVEVDTTVAQVKTWINTAISNKSWVILVFHQVDTAGGQYSVTPKNFQSIISYLKTKSASVVTVSQGVSLMNQ